MGKAPLQDLATGHLTAPILLAVHHDPASASRDKPSLLAALRSSVTPPLLLEARDYVIKQGGISRSYALALSHISAGMSILQAMKQPNLGAWAHLAVLLLTRRR